MASSDPHGHELDIELCSPLSLSAGELDEVVAYYKGISGSRFTENDENYVKTESTPLASQPTVFPYHSRPKRVYDWARDRRGGRGGGRGRGVFYPGMPRGGGDRYQDRGRQYDDRSDNRDRSYDRDRSSDRDRSYNRDRDRSYDRSYQRDDSHRGYRGGDRGQNQRYHSNRGNRGQSRGRSEWD